MRKVDLEIALSKLKKIENPKVELEQYQTPSDIAADILWKAYMRGDVEGKVVGDFGCGNGIFGVGAFLLGAKDVIFVDIDGDAIKVAKENSNGKGKYILGDVSLAPKVDVCFSNPPFGIQSNEKGFTNTILSKADVCYLLLPAGRKIDGEVIGRYRYKLPATFHFHRRRFYEFNVEAFRVERFK